MLVDFLDALAILGLNLALLLVDFLFSLRLDQWIILLGAKDWARGETSLARRLLYLRATLIR